MPRVVNPPRASGRSNAKQAAAASPQKAPIKIPLNDDRQEKMVRLQSRQALHDIQMNEIRAAASPMRKLNSFQRAGSTSPKTPGSSALRRKEYDEDGLTVVGGNAATPMKRVPILANFEEWMKMATDNKINATNSWNFALIDYFHDMSLLKEGDGVNFQKASCTLDGCVKIYTSRVDSVATETGKLLSGLAESGNKKRRGDSEEGEDGEDDEEEEDEDGVKRKRKKKTQRSSEATLAPSFASLQLKKFELEFSIDPLSKKAAADFDEGGVKGLLLNHLSIDGQGRIVFDSSDDAGDAAGETDENKRRSGSEEPMAEEAEEVEAVEEKEAEDPDIDIASLGSKYFPDLNSLDDQDICPSLKTYELGDQTANLDIPFLKPPEDWRQGNAQAEDAGNKSGIFLDDDNAPGFDDDDGALGGFDLPADTGFGEGGEVWARDAALEPQLRPHNADFENEGGLEGDDGAELGPGGFDAETGKYTVRLDHGGREDQRHEDILSYFDQALKKNWAGPEHWRIRRVKDIAKSASPTVAKRKEKEPFEIDFASPLEPILAEMIYTPAASNSSISLPKTQWRSKTRNLLPDDKHFNSKQLLRLFLKPKARMGSSKRRPGGGNSLKNFANEDIPEGEMDEAFWARKEGPEDVAANDGAPRGDYDANFFQDDGLDMPGGILDDDDDEFADAREAFSPELVDGGGEGIGAAGIAEVLAANAGDSQEGAFGTQLVTQSRRLRPEYVEYARVAKKVDVRKLKEEMWRGIGLVDPMDPSEQTNSQPEAEPVAKARDGSLKFTTVMNNLQSVYPKQAMADISTSYCFICLLHLANEKGLVLDNEEGLEELTIRKDHTAEIVEPV